MTARTPTGGSPPRRGSRRVGPPRRGCSTRAARRRDRAMVDEALTGARRATPNTKAARPAERAGRREARRVSGAKAGGRPRCAEPAAVSAARRGGCPTRRMPDAVRHGGRTACRSLSGRRSPTGAGEIATGPRLAAGRMRCDGGQATDGRGRGRRRGLDRAVAGRIVLRDRKAVALDDQVRRLAELAGVGEPDVGGGRMIMLNWALPDATRWVISSALRASL